MNRTAKVIGVTTILMLVSLGCERSDENRRDDEQVAQATSKAAKQAETDDSEQADDDGYQQLGRMYRQYGEACSADGADAGRAGWFCQRGMPGMMGRQMMHMHRNYGGWGRGRHHRMPMHGMGRGHHGMHDKGKGAQMGPMWRSSAMDVWHEQMADWHEQMAEQFDEEGEDDLAERHRQIMEHHRQMAAAFEGVEAEELEEPPSGDDEERRQFGRRLYVSACAACHGPNGEGVSDAFPPLAGSSIVAGESERLVRIVTYGLEGPIEVDGEVYDGVMPTFADRLSDGQIASILTYVRHAWHDGSSIEPSDVRAVREDAPDEYPLSSEELGLAP